jgi:aspartate-semialdehyde dehydrogenase
MALKTAIIGVGPVGDRIYSCLKERNFPVDGAPIVMATRARKEILGGDEVDVVEVAEEHFEGVEVAFFAGREGAKGASVIWKDAAEKAGAVCIDNGSDFRLYPDIPLVVPEVNMDDVTADTKFIASPNCSTIQMVVALKPLHDLAKIRRIVVATYQSVSGAGREAMDELFRQTRAVFVNDPVVKEVFHKQIAFNVIPHIDVFMDDASTKEEWKMVVETKKILDPKIKVTATCVRVPVFISHSEAMNVEFENPISAAEARAALKKAPGVTVIDHKNDDGFVTPVECSGEDAVFVSRIREDISVENGLNLWVVSDNLRKGAALNAVQIAELLAKVYLG